MNNFIAVLAYRADKQDGHILDDAIAITTRPLNPNTPPHSHSELLFPEGMCFSSATRGQLKPGTRWLEFETVTKHPERWDVYYKNVTLDDLREYKNRATKILDRPYNFAGLFLDFFLPLDTIGHIWGDFSNSWYCSQAVWYCLSGKRKRVSPRRLTTWILKEGFEKIEMDKLKEKL